MRIWRNWQFLSERVLMDEKAKDKKAPRSTKRYESIEVSGTARVTRSAAAKKIKYADMAELADALDSGSSRGNSVQVQVLLSAPSSENPYFKRFSGVFFCNVISKN